MTKEKIRQAAICYANSLPDKETVIRTRAFEAGAEWALENQWHEIDEKQPPIMQLVILADSAQRFGLGYIDIGHNLILLSKARIQIDTEEITHWCEMPAFENKQPKK